VRFDVSPVETERGWSGYSVEHNLSCGKREMREVRWSCCREKLRPVCVYNLEWSVRMVIVIPRAHGLSVKNSNHNRMNANVRRLL
jgi:hypothetical protein